MTSSPSVVAFEDGRCVAAGELADVAVAIRRRVRTRTHETVQVFDARTGRSLLLDLAGSEADVHTRYAPPPSEQRGPGRPKLGVVAREVTLLPRHWAWLNAQPGGASVALRKLVEAASKAEGQSGSLRERREAAYRFMTALAGDWPNYEESIRALYAGDAERFSELTDTWPADVRDHARHLAFDVHA